MIVNLAHLGFAAAVAARVGSVYCLRSAQRCDSVSIFSIFTRRSRARAPVFTRPMMAFATGRSMSGSMASGRRRRQFGLLAVGAGHIERLALARQIVGLNHHDGRWGARHEAVGGNDGSSCEVPVAESSAAISAARLARRAAAPPRIDEPELVFDGNVAALAPAHECRQVVRAEAGESQSRIALGRFEVNPLTLEPQHAVGENMGRGESFAQSVRNGAEIFADDHAAPAPAFDRGQGDERFGGKPHIGPVAALAAPRYPELPGESQDVIDAQCRGMSHVGREDRQHGIAAPFVQRQRGERRQIPHLTLPRERIGWRAERYARREVLGFLGDLAAIEGAAERQIAIQVSVAGGLGKLRLGDPLQERAVPMRARSLGFSPAAFASKAPWRCRGSPLS